MMSDCVASLRVLSSHAANFEHVPMISDPVAGQTEGQDINLAGTMPSTTSLEAKSKHLLDHQTLFVYQGQHWIYADLF